MTKVIVLYLVMMFSGNTDVSGFTMSYEFTTYKELGQFESMEACEAKGNEMAASGELQRRADELITDETLSQNGELLGYVCDVPKL